ncbi:MAG TPA: DUF4390 domain-containing protein [Betaproteobacteria bacterium]|nr:DUF4390 domain-containing protein [Betaproteobacteria bacterium]
MPFCTNRKWRRLLLWALGAAWLATVAPALADATGGVQVNAAQLTEVGNDYFLNADLGVHLTPTQKDALNKGVDLYFVLNFELTRTRFFWFHETIASVRQQYQLSYNVLTRQYQLSDGLSHKNYDTLAETIRQLGHIRQWKTVNGKTLSPGTTYRAGLQMKLDTSRLTKPMQLNALTSKDWTLDSGWHYWTITPVPLAAPTQP